MRHVSRGAGCFALISLLLPLVAGCASDDDLPSVIPRPAIVQGHPVPVTASAEAGSAGAAAGSSGTGVAGAPSPSALYFASDVYEVRDADRAALKAHAKRLLAHPELRLRIIAHTDPEGPPDYNAELARMRALSVKKALLGMGVPADQIETAAAAHEAASRKRLSQSQMAALRRVDLSYRAQE
jgi:outer membrane protein OmpA-like peptidoglycan-associated protein